MYKMLQDYKWNVRIQREQGSEWEIVATELGYYFACDIRDQWARKIGKTIYDCGMVKSSRQ